MNFKEKGIRIRPTTYFYNSKGELVEKRTESFKKESDLSKILKELE